MQKNPVDCQLSAEERRTLAQAEIASQRRLIAVLMDEFHTAMQRIRKARKILAEAE